MSITDDIRDAISAKVRIRYETIEESPADSISCIICKHTCVSEQRLYLYVKDEGRLCSACAERFVPEKFRALQEYKSKDLQDLLDNSVSKTPALTSVEWKDIKKQFDALLLIADDLTKGVSRGIVEAPAGHIGLLYLAKDIVKPESRDGEPEKDYDLRVKTYRIQKLQEKLKNEISGRILVLRRYFEKMGLPEENT